jgi:RarD protein
MIVEYTNESENYQMKNSKGILIIAMLIFGSIGLFVREINLPSSQIALMRGIIGSLFIIIASRIMKQKISWKAIKPNLILLITSGAAIGINWICLFQAYKYTTISNATLSYYFAPVIVMFLSPFILKEPLTAVKTLCISSALIGMFLIVGISKGSGNNHLLGIGYGVLAAVLYASVILVNKFMKGLTGLETTIMQLSIASVVLLPYVLATEKVSLGNLDSKSMSVLIIVGIVNTGVAYLLYFTAMKNLKGQTIAVYSYIDPIAAIIMSSIFLKESMTYLQIIGGILILGSTFFSEIYEKKAITKVINN